MVAWPSTLSRSLEDFELKSKPLFNTLVRLVEGRYKLPPDLPYQSV